MPPTKYICHLKHPYNKAYFKKINIGHGRTVNFTAGVAKNVTEKELNLLKKLKVLEKYYSQEFLAYQKMEKPSKKERLLVENRINRLFSGEKFEESISKTYAEFDPASIEPPDIYFASESIVNAKLIIIASGEGSRWSDYNKTPKHLIKIFNNESLLQRAVRLWRYAGAEDISIVTESEHDGYRIEGSRIERPDNSITSSVGGTKKFLDSSHLWSVSGRTIVIYGDVFWTWDAVRTVAEYSEVEWRLFARPDRSTHTGTPWGECFAQSFYPEHQQDHMSKLLLVESMYDSGVIDRAGGWEHYRAMCGLKGTAIRKENVKNHLEKMIIINDLTDDIDNPTDYARLVSRVTHDTSKVTVLIPYSKWECPHRNRVLSYILRRWESEYPEWNVIVGESEANPWRKSVSIQRALRQVKDGVVIIADADVWVPGIEHAVNALKGGFGWVKPHSLFVRLNEEATRRVLNDGDDFQELASIQENLEEIPYQQTPCGGVLVIHPEVARVVPADPRFEGWGGEDVSWSRALTTLIGANYMTDLISYHLWHPPQERIDRKTPNEKNQKLQERYQKYRGSFTNMDVLVSEAREELLRY
jgi:hypothetical protein